MDHLITILLIFGGIGLILIEMWEIKIGEEIIPFYYYIREANIVTDPGFFLLFVMIKIIIGILLILQGVNFYLY